MGGAPASRWEWGSGVGLLCYSLRGRTTRSERLPGSTRAACLLKRCCVAKPAEGSRAVHACTRAHVHAERQHSAPLGPGWCGECSFSIVCWAEQGCVAAMLRPAQALASVKLGALVRGRRWRAACSRGASRSLQQHVSAAAVPLAIGRRGEPEPPLGPHMLFLLHSCCGRRGGRQRALQRALRHQGTAAHRTAPGRSRRWQRARWTASTASSGGTHLRTRAPSRIANSISRQLQHCRHSLLSTSSCA